MGPGQRLAAVGFAWTAGGSLTGVVAALLLKALTVLAAPCALSSAGSAAAGLSACPAGPSVALLAVEFGFLGLLLAALGVMVMPGMRLDFAEAQALAAAAAQQRALDARSRPVPAVPVYAVPLAFR